MGNVCRLSGIWSSKELCESHCSIKHTPACWHFTLRVCVGKVGEFVWGRNMGRERSACNNMSPLCVHSLMCELSPAETTHDEESNTTMYPAILHSHAEISWLHALWLRTTTLQHTHSHKHKEMCQWAGILRGYFIWFVKPDGEDNICYAMLLEWVLKKAWEKLVCSVNHKIVLIWSRNSSGTFCWFISGYKSTNRFSLFSDIKVSF